MKLLLRRLYFRIRRYLDKYFNSPAGVPKGIKDEDLVEYMSEIQRSRKNGWY